MTDTCEECGGMIRVGDWPICKGDPSAHVPLGGGMLGGFKEYNDHDIAPPPSDVFKPAFSLPSYSHETGYRITSLRDRQKLMKANRADYRN